VAPDPNDTIVARATPAGRGAVAVVRLSGPDADRLAAILSPGAAGVEARRLVRVPLVDGAGEPIDDGMVVRMPGPSSYTGDDVVEFHVHGSDAVVRAVTERLTQIGARAAQPGEFTQRAFLNGRLSLDQAESVAALIDASSLVEARAALRGLAGELAQWVRGLLAELEYVLADWQLALDFPEDALEGAPSAAQHARLDAALAQIDKRLANSRSTRVLAKVVLCGAPNAGKSTLLNQLAGTARALVDEEEGTTRDAIDVEVDLAGLRVRIWDTAGLRSNAVGIEAAGVANAEHHVGTADLAVWLLSPIDPIWPHGTFAGIVIGSKADLADKYLRSAMKRESVRRGCPILAWVSGKKGVGVPALVKSIRARIDDPDDVREFLQARHLDRLAGARTALARVLKAPKTVPLDMRSADLTSAVRELGSIVGRDVGWDVLDAVFSRFCIGK
jgi:tRNA modification GTPase